MQLLRRYPGRTAGIVTAIVLAAACTDRSNPAGPSAPGGPGTPVPPGKPVTVATLQCTGNTQTKTVSCDGAGTGGQRNVVIIGGPNNHYVSLTSSNVNYNSGTQAFTFDVTIRNLIPQPLGTADTTGALTPDPDGIEVFFMDGPTVTAGTGAITVVGDGLGTFTAANQPYYRYSTVLQQYQVSSPRTWQMNMPVTVTSFTFVLKVAAAVPFPDGYVDVLGNFNVRSGYVRQLTATVRNFLGEPDTVPVGVAWTSSDTTRAVVDGTGLCHGLRFGTPTIRVETTSGPARYGKYVMNVLAVRRIWTGASGTTGYANGANWLPVNTDAASWRPDSVKPETKDTVVVPDTTAVFPALTQNEGIGGIEVLDITPGGTVPTLSLGAFNLDASGDVLTTNSGAIDNTSGVLSLTGIGRTVAGTLPFLRVTGTYSLIGNITVRAPIRVDLGRLTNTGFRIQATSF